MSFSASRRRVLALLGATCLVPIARQAHAEELPPCETKQTIGNWRITVKDEGWIVLANVTVIPAPLNDDVSSLRLGFGPVTLADDPIPAQLDVDLKNARDEASNPEIWVSKGSGSERLAKQRVTILKQSRLDASTRRFSFDVSNVFNRTPNPLLQAETLFFDVRDERAINLELKFNTAGFAQAVAFVKTEIGNLRAKHEAKQCKANCFFTEASCNWVGLSDDCFELSALRRFRDGPLAAAPGGAEDIARYYRNAPLILDEMYRRNEDHRLVRLYATGILPSALAAHLGFNRIAYATYRRMMQRLETRYLSCGPV